MKETIFDETVDFDELLEDYINEELDMDNIDRDSERDMEFEHQFMKELEPYTSKGVTYYVPRACQPKYSFRRLELKTEMDKLGAKGGKSSLILKENAVDEPVITVKLEDVYLLEETSENAENDIVFLLYRVGNAMPLIIRCEQKETYNRSMWVHLLDNQYQWTPGEYFLLVVNAQENEKDEESCGDTFHGHFRYPFRMLADGRTLEHPSIESISLSPDKRVEICLEGEVGKLDEFRLFVYNSDWVMLAEVHDLRVFRKKLKAQFYSSTPWMDDTCSMVMLHNGEPCTLVTYEWTGERMKDCCWQALEMTSPYYMMAKYMDGDKAWHHLCNIPGCRSLRKSLVERYGYKVLNRWREACGLSGLNRSIHLSVEVPDGRFHSRLAENVVKLLNESMSCKEVNCESLVGNKNSVDPYDDMKTVLDDCLYKVLCLHHLSALNINSNGKAFLHMLEEKLQEEPNMALMLMGTAGEIREVLEASPLIARLIAPENRLHTDAYSAWEQVRLLQTYFSNMGFVLSSEAMAKLVDVVVTHREVMASWRTDELKQWWAEEIYPRFMQRILTAGKVDDFRRVLYSLEPEDFCLEAKATPHDDFAGSVRELNGMVGLSSLKQNMTTLFNRSRFDQKRRDMGLPVLEKGGYHMIFTGNPGTGKTTVAKLVGRIYHSLGLLSKGGVIVTERTKLVGRYLGETERNMAAVLEQAKGNVLFIDEAYTLCDNDQGDRRDFGCRVLESLLTVLAQKNPDMIVILAGYEKEMNQMLEMNPGMKGRFPYKFNFEDYNADELFQIASMLLKRAEYCLTPEAESRLIETIQETVKQKDAFFHNARWVEQYILDGVVSAMSDRLMDKPLCWERRDLLQTIEVQDIEVAYQKMKPRLKVVSEQRKRIGFVA